MTTKSLKEPTINRRYSLLANHGNSLSFDKPSNPTFNITRSPSIIASSSLSSTPKRELYNKQKSQNEQKNTAIPKGYDEDPVETHDQVVRKLSMLDNFPSAQEISQIVESSQPVRDSEDEEFGDMDAEKLKEELRRTRREKSCLEAKNSTLENFYLQAISTNAHSQMTLDQVRGRSRYRRDTNDNSSTSSSYQLKASISNNNFMMPPMTRSRSGSVGLTKWSSNRELYPRKTSDQLDQSILSLESRDQIQFKSEDPEGRLSEIEKRIDLFFNKYLRQKSRINPDQIRKDYATFCRLQESYNALKDELLADEYLAERKGPIISRINITMNDAQKMLNDVMKKHNIRTFDMMPGSTLSLNIDSQQGNHPTHLENMSTISSVSNISSDFRDISQYRNDVNILEQFFENYVERYQKMFGLPNSEARDLKIKKAKEQLLYISRLVHPTQKLTTVVPEDSLKVYFKTWEEKNRIVLNDDADVSVDKGKLEKKIEDDLARLRLSESGKLPQFGENEPRAFDTSGNLRRRDSTTYSTSVSGGDSGLGDKPSTIQTSYGDSQAHFKSQVSTPSIDDSGSPNNLISKYNSQNPLRTVEQEPDSSTISQESRLSSYPRETSGYPNQNKNFAQRNANDSFTYNNNNDAHIYLSKNDNYTKSEQDFNSPFKVPELPRTDNSVSSFNGLKKQNSFSPSKLTRGISLRASVTMPQSSSSSSTLHTGQPLPVEHQLSPLNSLRQPSVTIPSPTPNNTSNSLSMNMNDFKAQTPKAVTNHDENNGQNPSICLNHKLCKLWLLRTLRNYNKIPRSQVTKDSMYYEDFECLSRNICRYCDGSLSEDLNYSQHKNMALGEEFSDSNTRDDSKVIRNGAIESPLIEMFDMKSLNCQPNSQTQSLINTNNNNASHNISKSLLSVSRPHYGGGEPTKSSVLRLPMRKYEPFGGNSRAEGEDTLKNSYAMREFNNNDPSTASQITTTSNFPSQNSLCLDEPSNCSNNFRTIEYISTGRQPALIQSPNLRYSSDDMRAGGQELLTASTRTNLAYRRSMRPPSIYEGVNDTNTLGRSFRNFTRSKSTNQIERFVSAGTSSDSSSTSPGISRPSSRYSKILSDAQTTTMLAQDLHKTLLSVKPL